MIAHIVDILFIVSWFFFPAYFVFKYKIGGFIVSIFVFWFLFYTSGPILSILDNTRHVGLTDGIALFTGWAFGLIISLFFLLIKYIYLKRKKTN